MSSIFTEAWKRWIGWMLVLGSWSLLLLDEITGVAMSVHWHADVIAMLVAGCSLLISAQLDRHQP
jgi:hypothetical protein